MASQISVPDIVITQPSPVIPSDSVVPIVEKAAPAPTAVNQYTPETPTPGSEPERNSIEHISDNTFVMASECKADCVVKVPEPDSLSIEDATPASSEPDRDDFRTESSTAGCFPIATACLVCYGRLWNRIDNRCRIPFWLILMTLPLSAGVMGSLYMFSCPACPTLPSAIFTIGVSLMAVLTLRICIIIHRTLCEDNENSRQMLHTLLLISTFVTVIFFLTESVIYWQMDSTSNPEASKYCDPTFVTYSFWWNCSMFIAVVPLLFFPA
jgi:hypothetical protein